MSTEPDPVLAETVKFLDMWLPAPLSQTGTQKLLWMDRFTLQGVLRVAKVRRDRNAETMFDPELERKLIKLLRVMVRNQHMFVSQVPIGKLTAIATGRWPRRSR
jgi:hypothetical protein